MSDEERFHITPWPGVPVPVPPVARVALTGAKPRGWLFVRTSSLRWEPIPDELFLRGLLDLGLDDRSIVRFLDDHGMIAVGGLERLFGADHEPVPDKPPGAACHLEDARYLLRTARALVRHWLAYLDGSDPLQAWVQEDIGLHLSSKSRSITAENAAWSAFVDTLNRALAPFHPRVEVPRRRGLSRSEVLGLTAGAPMPGLYSALCLQLLNFITEGLPARQCANETCGRLFVRQLGGARHGQHRTQGVRFCTPACAKAQAMRELRRRQRKEQER